MIIQILRIFVLAAVPGISAAFQDFTDELDSAVDNLITDITGDVSIHLLLDTGVDNLITQITGDVSIHLL